MDKNLNVYLFDMPAFLLDRTWERLVAHSDPDAVLYAAWAYLLHSDVHFLEQIAEQTFSSHYLEAVELAGLWLDSVFMHWCDDARAMCRDNTRILAGVRYEASIMAVYVTVKTRNQDEDNYPTYAGYPHNRRHATTLPDRPKRVG